jgi:hypothetical protein
MGDVARIALGIATQLLELPQAQRADALERVTALIDGFGDAGEEAPEVIAPPVQPRKPASKHAPPKVLRKLGGKSIPADGSKGSREVVPQILAVLRGTEQAMSGAEIAQTAGLTHSEMVRGLQAARNQGLIEGSSRSRYCLYTLTRKGSLE